MKTGLKEKRIVSAPAEDDPGVEMVWSDAESFLEAWMAQGRSGESQNNYRRALRLLFDALPEGKRIRKGTMLQWREQILTSGYSNSGVNVMVVACNQFLDYIGHSEYQLQDRLPAENNPQPELSRGEYQRLLATAKALGDERGYFLVKTFVCTGIHVQEMAALTVENVEAGHFISVCQGTRRVIRVPDCLRRELLDYAQRAGIRSGQIFLARNGKPLHRSVATNAITNLCEAARVPRQKGNPRCLRRLYLATLASVEMSFQPLIEQAVDRQLDQEQVTLGWEAG